MGQIEHPLVRTIGDHVGVTIELTALVDVIAGWLPQQRWFPAHDGQLDLRVEDLLTLNDPWAEADVHVLVLSIAGASASSPWFQVPVTLRAETATAPPSARVIGNVVGVAGSDESDPVRVTVTDGPGDPAFLRAWVGLAEAEPDVVAHVRSGLDTSRPRVISGEQSNTSVVLLSEVAEQPPGILKVFRGLTPGANPDVDVPRALTAAGFDNVPRVLAWQHGERPGGHLAVLSTFIPGAEDGFELACAHAEQGRSFKALMADLGATVAELHDALVRAFGTTSARAEGAPDVSVSLARRFLWARERVPALEEVADAVGRVVRRVNHLPALPDAQRIHADLHLGQVLRARDAWFVMDFEGEPLVPVDERSLPDQALRDVAGLVRSLDYAAARGGGTPDWVADARHGLLDAYLGGRSTGLPLDTQELVLGALELDKALYEVVYETENRPSWAAIPWAAVRRLVAELAD